MSYQSSKLLLLILLSGQLLVGCADSTSAPTSAAVISPSSMNIPISKTYTNAKYSYQFSYPSNAELHDSGTSQVAINLATYPESVGYISITTQPINEFAEYLSYHPYKEAVSYTHLTLPTKLEV